MQISRRDALMGASAAVAVATVAAPAVQADPVVVLVNKALTFRDWLNATPDDIPEEEFNAQCDELWAIYDQIRDTPATSVEGIAGKLRVAWIQTHDPIENELTGPPDDFELVGSLEPQRFIWSALQDLQRLAGGLPS